MKTKEKSYKIVWKGDANNYTQHLEIGDKKKSSLTSSSVSKSQLSLTSSTSSPAQSISGDPSIIRGQAWPHPVQREQAHQVASGLVEKISYFIFRSLTFGECLMRASYSPCGNDPKSEKKASYYSHKKTVSITYIQKRAYYRRILNFPPCLGFSWWQRTNDDDCLSLTEVPFLISIDTSTDQI